MYFQLLIRTTRTQTAIILTLGKSNVSKKDGMCPAEIRWECCGSRYMLIFFKVPDLLVLVEDKSKYNFKKFSKEVEETKGENSNQGYTFLKLLCLDI